MKLELQLTSLGLSKRLKELGVGQEGAFYWCDTNQSRVPDDYEWELYFDGSEPTNWHVREKTSAFTVAELGELLKNDEMGIFRTTTWVGGEINKWYATYQTDNNSPAIHADTEADARAKCLIYLLENNL